MQQLKTDHVYKYLTIEGPSFSLLHLNPAPGLRFLNILASQLNFQDQPVDDLAPHQQTGCRRHNAGATESGYKQV